MNFLMLFALLPQVSLAAGKEINQLPEGFTARSSDLFAVDRLQVFNYGLPTAASGTTITLTANSSATDDFFTNMFVEILEGPGAGQVRTITDYVGSTRIATVAAWTTNPTTASKYRIYTTYETYKAKLPDELWKDIKSEGAICDGESHTLADSSKSDPDTGYATLAAARVDYPKAVALTDEIDMTVIREMIENNEAFSIPKGTCLWNDTLSFSGKSFYWKQHPEAVIKGSGSEKNIMVTFSGGTPYFENLEIDGENVFQRLIYFTGTPESTLINATLYDYGWPSTQATDWVAGVFYAGALDKINIDGIHCSDIHSVGNGTYGDEIGGARCVAIAPSSNSKLTGIIKDYYADATGSAAEELDLFQLNVNVVSPGGVSLINPTFGINHEVRRCAKFHSGINDIWNIRVYKTADFVTAPTTAGGTDVGAKNIECVGWASTAAGSLTLHGGVIDHSAFPVGFTLSAASTTANVLAYGTKFVGGTQQVDRYDPETDVTGTATAGDTNTITLDPSRSSTANDWYNGADIAITGGNCAGNIKPVADYVGSSRLLTITGTWDSSCIPDITSIYHVYDAGTAPAYPFQSGSSSEGDGCSGCIFQGSYYGPQLRGENSFIENSRIIDPVYYAADVNPSSARAGIRFMNNEIITKTSGRLNNTYIIPVKNAPNIKVTGNRFVEDGNTTHASEFFRLTSVTSASGYFGFNDYPSTMVQLGHANGTKDVKDIGGNYAVETIIENNVTTVGNVGTGLDTLMTRTLDRATFWGAGSVVKITAVGDYANNANAKTVRYSIGASTSTSGTVQNTCTVSCTSSTIILATGASAVDDTYNGLYIVLTSGTGAGQVRLVSDYTGSTRTLTVGTNWSVTPDNSTTYAIYTLPALIDISLPTSQAGVWKMNITLTYTGSGTQFYEYSGFYTGASGIVPIGGNGTLSLTDTSTIVVKGEAIATTNNDVTQDWHYITKR